MVGGDDVYHVVVDGTAQGVAVGLGLHGRVALDESAQCAVVGLAEQQMGHTSLARNLLAAKGACLEQAQFAGSGEVEHMQAGTRFARQLHGQARRGVAGGRRADVGVLADGHVVLVGILCLVFLHVPSDGGGVLAMDGNEQVGAAENGAQALHAVHQHVARTRAHEELDAAHVRTVQAGKVAVVVVRGAEVGGVVHDAAFVQQVELGVEGFEGSGLRQGVGHVHDAGDASCGGRPAFTEDVGLVCQAWVAEVHVVVDGTRQQVAASGVDGFVARGGERFAVGQHLGDTSLVGDDHGALYGLSLVDDEGVVDEGTFHVCLTVNFRIFLEPAVPLQADDAEDGFAKDAGVHFRGAQLAVDEDDGHFLHLCAALVGGELHLDLEGITLEADGVEVDGLQHAAAVAHEARRGVVDGQARDDAHVFRGEVGHQHASHGPVHHVHAAHVARTDGHVGSLLGTGLVEAGQVLGVVAEVGVHLEDVFVVVLQRPTEACDVGRAQAQLAATLHHEQAVGELFALQAADNLGRTVGRPVFDDQDVETMLQGKDGPYDVLDILPLVVGRDDDDAV